MACLTKKTAQKFLADPKSVDLSKYTKVSEKVKWDCDLRKIVLLWRKIVRDDMKRSSYEPPNEWINQKIVIGMPPSNPLCGRGGQSVDPGFVSWWLPRNVGDWFWMNLENAHKEKYGNISLEAADLLNKKAIFWFWMYEKDKKAKREAKREMIATSEIHQQLAKIKKIINAKNSENFALVVELVRTLELDNEETWLSLLPWDKFKKISSLSERNTHLLLEIAAKGERICRFVIHNIALGGGNLTSLTYDEASLLALRGWLDLGGLKSLSDAVAKALSRQRGTLYLTGLATLSDAAAEEFGQHEGSLYLSGLKSLSDAAAESLARHKGLLALNGCLELSDHAASRLAKHIGRLELSSLQRLSERAVHEFAQHRKTPLFRSASLQESLKQARNRISKK